METASLKFSLQNLYPHIGYMLEDSVSLWICAIVKCSQNIIWKFLPKRIGLGDSPDRIMVVIFCPHTLIIGNMSHFGKLLDIF